VINNWQIAPIIRATSGDPFTVTSGIDNSFTALGTDRPNYLGGNVYLHTYPSSIATLNPDTLDKNRFTVNAPGAYGNLGRNTIVGPKFFNIGSSLSRSFPTARHLGDDSSTRGLQCSQSPELQQPYGEREQCP
jgi:hypothetical protein